MTRIFKYQLPVQDQVFLDLPTGATILSVAEQADQIVVYALIDDETRTKEAHGFSVVGTGHPVDLLPWMAFLGTVKLYGGGLMLHVFHDARRAAR